MSLLVVVCENGHLIVSVTQSWPICGQLQLCNRPVAFFSLLLLCTFVSAVLGMEPGALCMLCKHSASSCTPSSANLFGSERVCGLYIGPEPFVDYSFPELSMSFLLSLRAVGGREACHCVDRELGLSLVPSSLPGGQAGAEP